MGLCFSFTLILFVKEDFWLNTCTRIGWLDMEVHQFSMEPRVLTIRHLSRYYKPNRTSVGLIWISGYDINILIGCLSVIRFLISALCSFRYWFFKTYGFGSYLVSSCLVNPANNRLSMIIVCPFLLFWSVEWFTAG